MTANRKRFYQILTEGTLTRIEDERLASWKLQSRRDGTTLLTGPKIDSSALYGILAALRDSGIVLLGVREINTIRISKGEKNET